jgi:hypothetical protein
MTRFLLDTTFIVDVLNDRRESRKTETLLRSLILVPVVQQHGQAFRDTGGVIMAHFCSDAEIRSEDDCAGSGCEVLSAGSGQWAMFGFTMEERFGQLVGPAPTMIPVQV